MCGLASTIPAHAVDEGAARTDAAGADAAPPVRRASPSLHRRDPAAALAKRLDLDATQTAQVRRLLVLRQSQMRALWSDDAIAADNRVGALKAINERTEAQIRALLTEAQRKGYIQPRPSGSLATDPKPNVQEWLNASRPRQQNSSPPAAPDPTPR